jgi:transketolase
VRTRSGSRRKRWATPRSSRSGWPTRPERNGKEALPRGRELEEEWTERFDAYRTAFPDLAEELERCLRDELPVDWQAAIPDLSGAEKGEATRSSSGRVLQPLAQAIPNLMGGSADLGPSNNTEIKGEDSQLPGTPIGRNLHFGVREHAMGGILNGMALHGGVRVYGGTFLIFSDYMRPAIRLAALMELPVTYVFTHDSIGLGEDGPTHQPVEQLMALRAIPNLMDLRPADAVETAEAWRLALERTDGPAFLSLTRQGVPPLTREGTPDRDGMRRGGYVFREATGGSPRVILLASGSELQLALDARVELEADGIPTRVVSLPSWHLFSQQDPDYIHSVLPRDVPARVAVEAGSSIGWYRWIGSGGSIVGLDRFGASAPAKDLFRELGVTVEAVVAGARSALAGTH